MSGPEAASRERTGGDPDENPAVPMGDGLDGADAEVARRLSTFADLTHVVAWELEVPGGGLRWHAPFSRLIKDSSSGPFRIPPGDGGRLVEADALGDALLDPIIETVKSGVVWENYELVQEYELPGGEVRRVLVRAVAVPDPGVAHFFGIAADVSEPGDVPWITADVGERLQLLVEYSPDGIVVHQEGLVVYGNPAALRMVGLHSPTEALGRPIASFIHAEDLGKTVARLAELREPGDVVKGFEARLQRVDGSVTPVEVASARTSWGGKPAFQVIMRDVTERKMAEEEAQARRAIERRYAAAVAALEEGVVVVDAQGAVTAANDSAVRILGRRLDGGGGDAIFTGGGSARTNDSTPFAKEDLPVAVALARHEGTTDVVIGVHDEHGKEQWLSVSSRPIDDADHHDASAVVCSVSDITDRKHLLDRLAWEARNDPLTSLANRSGFLAAVEGALETRDAERDGLVMFFFDLDRFKLVNDSLGHAVGDEVLRAMAQRLRSAMPRAVSLSRLHGDEFAALETGVPDTDAALHRAEELRSILSRPVQLSTGRTLTVTPSIGLVRLADVGREASEVLQDADMAMLQAKTRGADGWPSSTPVSAKR